ncbi:LysE family translocator [Thauera linaloolentis]|uniref:Cysteine/O-acetylserine efflux protein n=1 Tax=Thauera linaloolentis (strain DSM 12138 / JCM 21573 / CCUG 41526 / CIP 105981 / IAM 15112 / NBRC 102519 / 47Lol) TaxID=1123367 RepID=N6Z770_THAL4|nr:LysE family translocator [Thauera linaloolentis]ENO90387.1 cysteine/O-acetylserine efflux protein [Thauera linaloolentis 47Lol = DSM 12138]MCM8564038.1 LysE family translocator [Thauera linaloolentis]
MSLALILPMSAFALAASISPGPVNMVCLGSGTRYGVRASLGFVSGATAGFIALFAAVGLGLATAMAQLPLLATLLRWSGIAFLLYLSWQLARDDGALDARNADAPPGFMAGALMQWLNPKAWLAAASGIGAYTRGAVLEELALFAALYAPICWASLACWVFAGAFLRRRITRPSRLRAMNRVLAALLAGSCIFLLID